jgi:hypothetical protein
VAEQVEILLRPDESATAAKDHYLAGFDQVSNSAAHGQPGDTVAGRKLQLVRQPRPGREPAVLDLLPDIGCDLSPQVLKPGAVNPAGTISKRHAVL